MLFVDEQGFRQVYSMYCIWYKVSLSAKWYKQSLGHVTTKQLSHSSQTSLCHVSITLGKH
ncbi:hypothetical protein E2C01_028330 [Portunus trituberculatus]|uniref:Uncharacterized protein n=1 Tax=Portunus trituberculatus TaxID=210409 RepID=A0A5B7ENV4_PORTR|nr:hypothetical protein [Portunus trituberculatus]